VFSRFPTGQARCLHYTTGADPYRPMYFAKPRLMVIRGETLIPVEHDIPLLPERATDDHVPHAIARMHSLHGAIRSEADTLPKIIEEISSFAAPTENRVIDHDQEGSWS